MRHPHAARVRAVTVGVPSLARRGMAACPTTLDSTQAMTNEATPTVPDAREERGRQLARAAQIQRVGWRWAVPSQTRPAERYLVDVEDAACTCPDYEEHRKICKHQHAVFF